VRTMLERPVSVGAEPRGQPPTSRLEEFEQVHLRNVDVLMGYFARRCRDPQTVADLTSETVVRAVHGLGHHLLGGRGPSRQRPGNLHTGAGCQHFGASPEGPPGRGRHGGYPPGPDRRQHWRRHLASGPLRRHGRHRLGQHRQHGRWLIR
jgi:hypothetical protein